MTSFWNKAINQPKPGDAPAPNGSAQGMNGSAPQAAPAQPAAAMSATRIGMVTPKAPRATAEAPGPAAAEASALSPEMRARIDEMRTQIQLSVGQIVLAIMNLPRYRHQTVADLAHVLIEPLLRNRIAVAYQAPKSAAGTQPTKQDAIAGIAVWATVSDAVDAKITEQIRAGVFPVRLAPEDWTSGEHVWLLDVVAGDRRQATSVLANFRQLAGEAKAVKIHPIVGRLIDPAVLEKLKVAQAADAAQASAAGQPKAWS